MQTKIKKAHALNKLIKCIFGISVVCQNHSDLLWYKHKLSALIDETKRKESSSSKKKVSSSSFQKKLRVKFINKRENVGTLSKKKKEKI